MSIENALYDDGRVLSAAAVGVPDARLGELPMVFVVLKHDAKATEAELIESVKPRYAPLWPFASTPVMDVGAVVPGHSLIPIPCFLDRLPPFAMPVMIIILSEHMATNAAGKILKDPLRAQAKAIWEKRKKSSHKAKL